MAQVTDDAAPIDDSAIQRLRAAHRGQLISRSEPDYDEARQVWNAMIDRHPGLIARPAGAADVVAAVNFAREQNLVVAVKGGGHNLPGTSVCEDGLVIDFSARKAIRVDPAGHTVRAEPGVRWGEFDRETQGFGLATTGGTFSDTGIAGLTLGGGVGWLGPRYGLAHDNLVAVDIVTAEGQLLRASEDENADLFWAVRGGGGNFGVVTSFEYRLHEVGPLLGGLVAHPFPRAKEALQFYREFSADMPDELATAFAFLTHPQAGLAVGMAAVWNGPLDQGEAAIKPLREFGPPVEDNIGPIGYCGVQTMLDHLASPRRHYYAKAPFLNEFSDEVIEAAVASFAEVTSPLTLVVIQYKGGEMARGAADRTAFGHRDASHIFVIFSSWADPVDAERHIAWTRGFDAAIRPFGPGGEYVNDLGLEIDEGNAKLREAYGAHYDRLVEIKSKYDPGNLFRHNQNIGPTV
jgi:FAD/FMN-containing dehydrogenase